MMAVEDSSLYALALRFQPLNVLVVLVLSLNLGDVTLTVTNTLTGEVWFDVFDSGTDPQAVLPISSTDGLYEIVYITETGDVYEGSFVIE